MARRAENFLLYISNAIAATACIIMALS
jgi:hypothetical protein